MSGLKTLILLLCLFLILPLATASGSLPAGVITDNQTCVFVNQSLDQGGQVNCPENYTVTGGGFVDTSGINEDRDKSTLKDNGWFCEDSPGKGECYAVCCRSKYISTESVSQVGSQSKGIKADCGNKTLVGGGFIDNSGKNDDQDASIASGNGWYCLDYTSSANSECSAVCATPQDNYDLVCKDVTTQGNQESGVQVSCPEGYFVTGGGFTDGSGLFLLGGNYDMDFNMPKDNGWYCKQKTIFSKPSCYARCCAFIEKCTDLDEDGFYSQKDCGTAIDCNDHNPLIFPGANETCDFKDNNCDGKVDEGCNITCSKNSDCGQEAWLNNSFCIDDKASWTSEGITGYIYNQPVVGASSFYEFYNLKDGSHFYTASEQEKAKLETNYSEVWKYEQIAGYIFSEKKINTVPLYRFYNLKNGDHFYTLSEEEKAKLEKDYPSIWQYEGIAGYIFKEEQNNSISLYRYYNLYSSFHFYTLNPLDLDRLEKDCSFVWDSKKTYQCVKPGTYGSSCQEPVVPQFKEDCGADVYEKIDYFCKDNDVYLYTKIQDKGCLSGTCYNNLEEDEVFVENCTGSCLKGKCFEAICGDKVINNGEECDDGNKVDGDGCSSKCIIEECNKDADCPKDYEDKSCKEGDSIITTLDFSCLENKCKEETSEQSNKCGVDSCTQWEYYCYGNQSRKTRTCYQRGCLLGECYANASLVDELVEECKNGCSLGECKEGECSKDSECGTDYYGANYCKNDDVWNDLHDFKCLVGECNEDVTPTFHLDCGTDSCSEWQYYCEGKSVKKERACYDNGCLLGECYSDSNTEEEFVEKCIGECKNGECLEGCKKSSDCGEDYYSDPYCKDGNSYWDFHDFSCVKSECKEKVKSELKSTCKKGCSDGECQEIRCYEDSDCGTDGWVDDFSKCSKDDLFGIWKEYECKYPGTQKSKCKSTESFKLKEDCGEDECEEWQYYCKENELWGTRVCYNRGCNNCNNCMCYEKAETKDKYIKTCNPCSNGACL